MEIEDCGNIIHTGLQVISPNFILQLLPQKKLEIFADNNHE